jgi:hypothetical protein
MRRIVDPAKLSETSAVDLLDLLEDGKATLKREIEALGRQSKERPLKALEADTLISYIKLLKVLVKDEEAEAKSQGSSQS